jgi:hypothetical protein
LAGQGCNTILTAAGVGSFQLRTHQISFSMNVICTEDQSSTYKYLYTRQAQTDTFALQVIYDSMAERDSFFNWYYQYANLAIVPSPVGSIRVQIPSRNFDMTGTLISGLNKTNTPSDVLWDNTLEFKGATFTNQSGVPLASKFVASPDPVASKFFYPESTDLNAAVTVPGTTPALVVKQATAVQALIAATQGMSVTNKNAAARGGG